MPLNAEKYFLPIEIADRYRYSVSFVYLLVRKKRLGYAKVGRQIRIPRKEVCRVFCQGTGDCDLCLYRAGGSR